MSTLLMDPPKEPRRRYLAPHTELTGDVREERGGNWLTCCCTANHDGREGWESLLAINGELPGGARFALTESGALELRAEAWVEAPDGSEGEVDFERTVHPAETALFARASVVEAQQRHGGLRPPSDSWIRSPSDGEEMAPLTQAAALVALCRTAGWEARERSVGIVAVTLETPGAFFQADVRSVPPHVRIRVPLQPWAGSDPCRRAAARFLLAASHRFRAVRPVIDGGAENRITALEAVIPGGAGPGELHDAFSSLSVACARTRRELRVLLADESVARAWLAFSGHL